MTNIYEILTNDAAVLAITDRIFYDKAEQGEPLPLVTFKPTTIDHLNGLEGVQGGSKNRMAVHCYGLDQQQSIDLYNACFKALKTKSNIFTTNALGELDPSGEGFLSQFDVSIWT